MTAPTYFVFRLRTLRSSANRSVTVFARDVGNGLLEVSHNSLALLGLITVALLSEEVCTHYGALRCQLESTGQPIGVNDLWIAAHGLADAMTVVTNNTREFARVPNLSLEDWTA